MSARQYKPFPHQATKPLIIYPVKDENPLEDVFTGIAEIRTHVDALYKAHDTSLKKGDYHILFIWNLEGHRMTDVWIHDMKNWSDSGPLAECQTFRDLEPCDDAGIASGDSLIALDREKHQPSFPSGMQPDVAFAL